MPKSSAHSMLTIILDLPNDSTCVQSAVPFSRDTYWGTFTWNPESDLIADTHLDYNMVHNYDVLDITYNQALTELVHQEDNIVLHG